MATTILVLAANPVDTPQLRLDEEVREINSGLERSRKRDEIVLKPILAARQIDVRRAMLDYEPNIVHFSGHGAGAEGIAFQGETGGAELVNVEALAGFFKLFADKVTCIVLNACYSEAQAEAIAKYIPYVIGMNKEIGDKPSIDFAVAFYDALGAGKSVQFAYDLACNAIEWQALPEALKPILKLGPRPGETGFSPLIVERASPSQSQSTTSSESLRRTTETNPPGAPAQPKSVESTDTPQRARAPESPDAAIPLFMTISRRQLEQLKMHQGLLDDYVQGYLMSSERFVQCNDIKSKFEEGKHKNFGELTDDYWKNARASLTRALMISVVPPGLMVDEIKRYADSFIDEANLARQAVDKVAESPEDATRKTIETALNQALDHIETANIAIEVVTKKCHENAMAELHQIDALLKAIFEQGLEPREATERRFIVETVKVTQTFGEEGRALTEPREVRPSVAPEPPTQRS